MKTSNIRKIIATVLVMVLTLTAIVATVVPGSATESTKTYTMTADDITAFAAGAKADGDIEQVGTDGFFNVIYSTKTKVDASKKTFEDDVTVTNRISWGGNSAYGENAKNAIQFKVENKATLKIWFVSGGDGREVTVVDANGTAVATTAIGTIKNSLYIATLEIPEAGVYYVGNAGGSNNYYKLEVSEEAAPVAPVVTTYTLDATADLEPVAQGAKADGDAEKAGTENFFTIYYSAKTKVDSSEKTFDDGYTASQRINMGGSTSFTGTIKNAIEFNTESAATVKVWWVCGGDGRELQLAGADGTVLESKEVECVKNSAYISTFEIAEAGKYFIGSTKGSNYYFKVEVTVTTGGTVEKPERADWASVAAPVITAAADNGKGNVEVTVNALVGYDGADEVKVVMLDAEGNELASKRSIAEKSEHTLTFTPTASGEYIFKATIIREGEEAKTAEYDVSASFKYVLGAPVIISATSKGQGKLEVAFTEVKEATGYEVLINGEVKASVTTAGVVLVEGLTVGESVTVSVNAVRGTEKVESVKSITTNVTAEALQTWGFTAYGPSTNTANNGYIGSVNEDGSVTVYSEGGKGKIQPNSQDGLAFYYTAIPTEYNFTLRATVTVDSWTISNGQEGFGLMAADRLGTSGDGSDFWNNSYLVGSTKFEYRYESDEDGNGKVYNNHTLLEYAAFPKYSMKLGLGVIERTGVNPDNLDLFQKNDTTTIQTQFKSDSRTFESLCGYYGMDKGTYNIIGNCTNNAEGTLEDRFLMTTFVLEIQKNNTGYFATYYDTEGNIIAQEKFYDPDALSKLDSENVYVGFFASRNARATFSDITLDTVLPSEDKPAEERPIEYVKPTVSLASPTVTTELDYEIAIDTNVDGTLKITLNNKVIAEGVEIKGLIRYKLDSKLIYGENELMVTFTPDPDQNLGEYVQLETTANQSFSVTINVNKGFYHNKVVYVSKDGTPNGNGTKEYPIDIYTAINSAIPGQTIVIMEGTYILNTPIKIQREMDGTAEEPIKMIADPEALTRPVFDFQKACAGIVHAGDYWYFYGFDVTNTANMQKGFQVSGNYNTLDNIHTYYNGNTGIQICRYSANDTVEDWPAYNLVLNCTSYCNYDAGFEDADGFAAKLTIGPGNVFDGCIAYNNADDGWDLYAKVETGEIGSVTIKNCVAYANGFIPGMTKADGTPLTGNGNGFKLGGSSLSGKHVLINCYAFYNLAKGIDSNSCPDIIVENCISYNNGSYNCAFYTNVGDQTDFAANGIISFKDADIVNHIPVNLADPAKGEQLKGKGTQASGKVDEINYINASTYYWDGTQCANTAGVVLTADIFKSLTFTGITRNEDGTINMNGFLELTEAAPENAGARPDGSASGDNSTLPEGDKHEFGDAWVTLDNQFHWHECECGFTTDLGAHEYEYVIDVMPTETSTGWKHRECTVCGKQGPKIEVYYDEMFTPDENPDEIPDETPDETPDDNENDVTPPADPHADCKAENVFMEIINKIINFFLKLLGKPEKCYCGQEK